MEADLLKILDRTILNVQRMVSFIKKYTFVTRYLTSMDLKLKQLFHLQLKPSANTLIASLYDFADIALSKAEINLHKETLNLETKLRSARRQNAERKGQLCKLWTDFRIEIDFVNEIITQNCTLIVQQQQKDQKLIAKEKYTYLLPHNHTYTTKSVQ